jgi:hypothetical protein
MPRMNRLLLEWLPLTPIYSIIYRVNIIFYLRPVFQEHS